jgi:hypothetical protein
VPTDFSFENWVEPTEDSKTYYLKVTVTGKTGRRTLVPTCQATLAFWAIRRAREEKLGHKVDPNERVFCLRDGKFQSADSLRPLFKRLLEAAEEVIIGVRLQRTQTSFAVFSIKGRFLVG